MMVCCLYKYFKFGELKFINKEVICKNCCGDISPKLSAPSGIYRHWAETAIGQISVNIQSFIASKLSVGSEKCGKQK